MALAPCVCAKSVPMHLGVCCKLSLCRAPERMLQEDYTGALDVLLLSEEAFQLCNPAHLTLVDNTGLLQVDIVW